MIRRKEVNTTPMFAKLKAKSRTQFETYCDCCGRVIANEEPMAMLAAAPPKGECNIHRWVKKTGGTLCCQDCFENRYGTLRIDLS